MRGTHITCTDDETGDSSEVTIVDDYCVICDGRAYVAHIAHHANGTTVITIKKKAT